MYPTYYVTHRIHRTGISTFTSHKNQPIQFDEHIFGMGWKWLKPTRTSHPKKTLGDIFCFVLEICPTESQKNQPDGTRRATRADA